ncbi:hypothetical protein PENSPDRAFT_667996 [Peniophora sp. CONT]|nr:hypothetical protein PENSPDRAFT_667996 [Peniophora sp. CONT]
MLGPGICDKTAEGLRLCSGGGVFGRELEADACWEGASEVGEGSASGWCATSGGVETVWRERGPGVARAITLLFFSYWTPTPHALALARECRVIDEFTAVSFVAPAVMVGSGAQRLGDKTLMRLTHRFDGSRHEEKTAETKRKPGQRNVDGVVRVPRLAVSIFAISRDNVF